MTVVLDLDETLVCAYHRNKVPADLLHSTAKSFEVAYNLGDGRMGNVVVFPRPGVQAFLGSVAAFAELIVFTAGHAGYAEPVIEMLDPEDHLFAAKLYRPETVRTHGQDYVKDLRRLGRCLSRTVLVDNDPFSGLLQPCNVVPASPFYGDPSDRQLMQELLPFLKGLSGLSDVRPTLGDIFNMPEYFFKHGYCMYEDASGYLTAAATIIS
ncbi:g11468 [Coccomyxa elongata]